MSHQVETMFSVKETPWHKLGHVLPDHPSIPDAMRLSGLDWEVGLKSLQTADGIPVTHNATYRMSDGKILGVVGPAYEPLQNAAAFDFFAPFLESGVAKLETAGSLRGGQRVWILASLNLDPSEISKGDAVRKFVLLSHAHDGTMACRTGLTPIRVVCANTLAMAINDKSSQLIRIAHRKGMKDALVAVRDCINTANATFEATMEQYRALANKGVSDEDVRKYVNLVFAPARVAAAEAKKRTAMVLPSRVHEGELIDEEETISSRVVDKIRANLEAGRGHELAGKTYWGLYNATTEFLQYERGSDSERRLDQAWFGAGMELNRRALNVGLQMAA